MKKIIGLVLIVLAFAGCNKSSSEDGEYYVKFKVNGQQVEYRKQIMNNNVLLINAGADGFYYATITGMLDTHDGASSFLNNFIQISVKDTVAVRQGFVYNLHDGVTNNGFNHPRIILTYTDDGGTTYTASMLRSSYPNINILNETQVVFSEINGSHAKGTFTATALKSGSLTETIAITDGEFYLKVSGPQ
jgi:hypothetical protein